VQGVNIPVVPRGVRYLLRQFTATAVREHIRSQIESPGAPELTKNEIDLVQFVRNVQFDWDGYVARRPDTL
jgi:hypothetical protein